MTTTYFDNKEDAMRASGMSQDEIDKEIARLPGTSRLVNGTIGVPLHLSVPLLLTAEEFEANKGWFVANEAPTDAADDIVTLVRNIPTSKAYKTYGTVRDVLDKDGNIIDEKLNLTANNIRSWIPNKFYIKALRRIAKKHLCDLNVVESIDTSFRTKRARGNILHYDPNTCKSRHISWYQVGGRHMSRFCTAGKLAGGWFDVTLSSSPTEVSVHNTPEMSENRKKDVDDRHSAVLRTCVWRECPSKFRASNSSSIADVMNCRVCSICGATWYCSRSCQKRDWKDGKHKDVCVAPGAAVAAARATSSD